MQGTKAAVKEAHNELVHILVVDDDPRITDLLRRILAYEGYSVAIAASGNEALNRSLERPPDLVVLDIMLPELNGLEVAQRLRAAGGLADLLDRRHQQADENRNNGDHHQQLDERETLRMTRLSAVHCQILS